MIGRERRYREEGEEIEEKLGWEEVKKAIGKLKDGKATGMDEISREVWKCGGGEIEGRL